MASFDDSQTKIRKLRTRGAIELALAGKWRDAVTANQEIVAEFPGEVDAYNRLGRAYLELGGYSQARAAYQRTLELDGANTIARKNLDRLSQLGEDKEVPDEETSRVEPRQFLEETGYRCTDETDNAACKEFLAAPPSVLKPAKIWKRR